MWMISPVRNAAQGSYVSVALGSKNEFNFVFYFYTVSGFASEHVKCMRNRKIEGGF